MIFFSKLAAIFALPPGCIILVLLLLVVFVPRKLKYFLGLVTLFLYLLSIRPVSDFLLRPLEDAYPVLPANVGGNWPQAIVVLGGGTIQNSPEAGRGKASLSSDAMKRAVYAFTLRERFSAPIVFSGGKVFGYEQESEAAAAGRLFEALGLPAHQFIAESKSRNTWENAEETLLLFLGKKEKLENVILVTSAYHVKRGVFCFRRNGMTVIPAPTDYKCDRGRKYDVLSFLPSMAYLKDSHLALHEYIGLLYYIVVYRTMG